MLLPLVPTARNTHIFRPGDFIRLISEIDFLAFEALSIKEHCLECLPNVPILAPKLPLFSDLLDAFILLLAVILLDQGFDFFLNPIPVNVHFVLQSIELCVPALRHILLFDDTVKGILPQFLVGGFVFVALDCPPKAPLEILSVIGHEVKAISLLSFVVVLKHRVLEPPGSEGDHGRSSAEELMLHYSSWLEQGRHKGKITADIGKWAVGEEQIRVAPERFRVLAAQLF